MRVSRLRESYLLQSPWYLQGRLRSLINQKNTPSYSHTPKVLKSHGQIAHYWKCQTKKESEEVWKRTSWRGAGDGKKET